MTVLDRVMLLACFGSLSLSLAAAGRSGRVGPGTKLSLNPGFSGHQERNT